MVPLSGPSNPLHRIKDGAMAGARSDLARVFACRAMVHFGLECLCERPPRAWKRDVVVTYVAPDQPGVRELRLEEDLVDEVPWRKLRAVLKRLDPSAVPLREQMRQMGDTDVLVAVQGSAAALALILFLTEGSAVAEVADANPARHSFALRNLALLMGHTYFSITEERGRRADARRAVLGNPVVVNTGDFVQLVSAAPTPC